MNNQSKNVKLVYIACPYKGEDPKLGNKRLTAEANTVIIRNAMKRVLGLPALLSKGNPTISRCLPEQILTENPFEFETKRKAELEKYTSCERHKNADPETLKWYEECKKEKAIELEKLRDLEKRGLLGKIRPTAEIYYPLSTIETSCLVDWDDPIEVARDLELRKAFINKCDEVWLVSDFIGHISDELKYAKEIKKPILSKYFEWGWFRLPSLKETDPRAYETAMVLGLRYH